MSRRRRGVALIDVICAFAMLTILAGAHFAASSSRVAFVGDALHEAAALRIASSRLETALDLAPGTSDLPLSPEELEALPGGGAVRVVASREPGLYEVTVRVSWGPRSVDLTTLRMKAGR